MEKSHRPSLCRHSIVLAALALAIAWPGAARAIDTSKITASCKVSNSPAGPFSATGHVTLLTDTDLFVELRYHNDDFTNQSLYAANFTATLLTSGSFGLQRVIDTKEVFGGAGLSQGKDSQISLRSGNGTATNAVVIRVTSDVTGTAVLARCDFIVDPVPFDDDIDKDGIPNDIERFGLLDPSTGNLLLGSDGKPVADFPSLGANPCRKDIAVEIDYQTGAGHTHRPDTAALDEVKAAFANAPVLGSPGCPFAGYDSLPGINLITEIDDAIVEGTTIDPQGHVSITPWDCGVSSPFEPARAPFFRHSTWVHSVPQRNSGLTPCGGAIVVALGLFSGTGLRFEAGTFMHELGHALGLGHGGDSGINLKPNYLSIMNYSFQEGIPDDTGGRIDYSRTALPELDEGALSEATGIQGPPHLQTKWWGPHARFFFPQSSQQGNAQGSLDWNFSGAIDTAAVSLDINSDGVCVGPGPNNLRETDPEGDDVVASNIVFNGPDLVCNTRPCNRNVEGCDDVLGAAMLACVLPGANGLVDAVPVGDDILGPGVGGVLVAGPNAVCETTAVGDDFQFTMAGRSEPRLLGHDDWSAIGRGLAQGAGVSLLEPQPNWTPEEREAVLHSGDPNADVSSPTTFATVAPVANASGWHRSDVTVSLSANDPDGVGDVAAIGYRVGGPQPTAPTWVAGASTSIQIGAEGQTPMTFYSIDHAGNTDAATTLRLNLDRTAPTLAMPALVTSYPYNSTLMLEFSAHDSASGVASQQATFNGSVITTGTTVTLDHLGTNTFTFAAYDIAGNLASQTATFSVEYAFGGFLPPLNSNGSGVYKLGSVVPVKFQLRDATGAIISTAVARLTLQAFSGGAPVGTAIDATPPGSADSGSLFRFDGSQYIYNLSTKPLSTGTWQVQVHLDDGTVHGVTIGLK